MNSKNCKIKNIEYHLPERVVTNRDLFRENPSWDQDEFVKKAGVTSRHIAHEEETALDLACVACDKIFSTSGILRSDIDGIIFCTQSPDYILPPNASVLHERLGLKDNVLAFDINLACSGYLYGLAIAKAFLNTYDLKNILLVTADTYSKYIHPHDKSVRLLFGDGAAVSLIQPGEEGIIDIKLGSYGKGYSHFMIPAGGCRLPRSQKTKLEIHDKSNNIRTSEHIYMEGYALLSLTRSKVVRDVQQILKINALSCEDIKLFIFHQASQFVLETLTSSLGLPKEKVYNNLSNIGNTVSASIPITIKNALNEDMIKCGDKILISGFGVGFSWGSAILEWMG